MPSRIRKAFIGAIAAPRSRRPTAWAWVVKARSPKVSLNFRPWYAGSGSESPGKRPEAAQSKRPLSTTPPPITVPLPDRNLVAEWTTRSAPQSIGRQSQGVASVLSTMRTAPAALVSLARVSRSETTPPGLARLSTKSALAPTSRVASTAARSSVSTKSQRQSNFWNVLLN